jgi:ferritin heavy chain
MYSCRQNFSKVVEDAINEQINLEMSAFYHYLSAATFLNHEHIALNGLYKFFTKASKEEMAHAQQFIDYQIKRGGSVQFSVIKPGPNWKSPLQILQIALQMELKVNESLLYICKLAEDQGDHQLSSFIEIFLEEQISAQKELSDMITNLKRVGNNGIGLYLFDQQLDKD